jgi:hypothetical protein
MFIRKGVSSYYESVERRKAKAKRFRQEAETFISAQWGNPAAIWPRISSPKGRNRR